MSSAIVAFLESTIGDVQMGWPQFLRPKCPETIPNPGRIITAPIVRFGIEVLGVGQEVMKCKTQEQQKHNETQAELVRKPRRGTTTAEQKVAVYASNMGTWPSYDEFRFERRKLDFNC